MCIVFKSYSPNPATATAHPAWPLATSPGLHQLNTASVTKRSARTEQVRTAIMLLTYSGGTHFQSQTGHRLF